MAIIFTTMLLHESGASLDPLKPLGACFLRTALQRAVPPQVEKHPNRAKQRRCLPAAL